ncbi:MAG TPA: ROK family transcriptional regulator [Ktedonobacterales bacterium]
MREANIALVLRLIRQHGPLARVAIARRTGLSRTTVSSIVDSLLAEEIVREGETLNAAPSGGRRPTLVHFNESSGLILGADMGRTHFTIIATDLDARILARRSGPWNTDNGPDVCLPRLIDEIRSLVSERHLDWERVVGLGIGIPGPVDANLHTLVAPPRMAGWDGVDVEGILRAALHVPVILNNDTNVGALAESRYGAAAGESDFAYVKVGTGIGCGLVINGEIYRGSSGVAGEIGHFTVDEDGPLCDCGNRGCLEAVAGAPQIVRYALEAGYDQGEGVAGAANLSDVDVAEVVQAALNGDAACQLAIRRASELIGVALANLVNLVNPSVILLDGSVARAGEYLLAPIRKAIEERSLWAASHAVRVQVSALGDSAIALGAATMVLDAVFGSPVYIEHVAGGDDMSDAQTVGAASGASDA